MGYEITYGFKSVKIRNIAPKIERKRMILGVISLVFAVLTIHFFFILLQIHILGQTEVAAVATDQMIENLKAGVTFKDAVDVFCSEILK